MKKVEVMGLKMNKHLFVIIAITLAVASIIAGLLIGSVPIDPSDIGKLLGNQLFGIGSHGATDVTAIIWEIRLPRVILAFLVGASLSLAGAAFQGLLRNPLVDPYTIGVSSGASLGAVLVIFFQWQLPVMGDFTLPVVAITASGCTLFVVLLITRAASRSFANETIILTGIIFNSFVGALVTYFIATASSENFRQILFWLMGSVSMRNWSHVQLLAPFFVVAAIVLLFQSRVLNALSLGEESAHYIGVNVKRKRLIILTSAAVLTGAAVSVSGAIGFVGLVIPHLVRLIIGPNHRLVLPLSIIVGGTFLVIADMVARTIISPSELPIGVVTAIIGAPIFTILLVRQSTRGGKP